MPEPLTVEELPQLTKQHIKDVCRPGEGSACCRYLTLGSEGWQCSRIRDGFKAFIDLKVERGEMTATADNCEGRQGSVKP